MCTNWRCQHQSHIICHNTSKIKPWALNLAAWYMIFWENCASEHYDSFTQHRDHVANNITRCFYVWPSGVAHHTYTAYAYVFDCSRCFCIDVYICVMCSYIYDIYIYIHIYIYTYNLCITHVYTYTHEPQHVWWAFQYSVIDRIRDCEHLATPIESPCVCLM